MGCFLVALVSGLATWADGAELPVIQKNGLATQLMVDGRPYLALAGELHNSSASNREYMAPIWPKLAQLKLNTVLAVVSWQLVEPVEGRYDFSSVDHLLEDARKNNLRLMLLWFGSWKNGLSHYVPAWVKADQQRFPRVRTANGSVEVLSPFSEANMTADAKAYAEFMKYLGAADPQRTVIMVQVENEVGLIGDTRDRGELAEAAFKNAVPVELMNYLGKNRETLLPETRALWQAGGFKTAGTWTEIFGAGPGGEEAFMAWHFARYVGRIAAAGKAEYALPVFVNAWIVQPEDEYPGEYPSGGPQAHMLDFWRAGAGGAVDLFTPDIYVPNYEPVLMQFTRNGNGLFVPESRAGVEGAGNAFLSIGQYRSIGYSPFGIDGREADPASSPIRRAYEVLGQLSPVIIEAQAKGTVAGVLLTPQNAAKKFTLGNYTVTASLRTSRRATETVERGYGVILQMGPDEYVVAGADLHVTFSPLAPSTEIAGLATVEEGTFAPDGAWKPGRTLNGDEIMISYEMPTMAATLQTGTGVKLSALPAIQRVKLYRFR